MSELSLVDWMNPHLGRYSTTATGYGRCPTGHNTRFEEEVAFTAGDGWIQYDQRATDVDGAILHTESGVLRPRLETDDVEIVLVMNSGRVEIGTASFDSDTLLTESTVFHNDRLGVIATRRTFRFGHDGCTKELWLANPTWTELTPHMSSHLQRNLL